MEKGGSEVSCPFRSEERDANGMAQHSKAESPASYGPEWTGMYLQTPCGAEDRYPFISISMGGISND